MGNTETNRVTGDNPNTVAVVEDLLSQLESMGARISQSFQAVVEGSEVSVRYTKEREGVRFVIDVPALCCPILNDFHYTVDKDFKISATLVEEPDNPAALPVMEKLIAFFNETNKLHDWHKNYPVFQLLRFPHILNNLFSITSESELSYLSNLCNSYMNGTEEEASFALLLTFFGSRVMTFDQSSYGDLDIKLKQPKTKCFIPGLDLINHQINGPAFRFYGPGVSVQAGANPGPSDEEIYFHILISAIL